VKKWEFQKQYSRDFLFNKILGFSLFSIIFMFSEIHWCGKYFSWTLDHWTNKKTYLSIKIWEPFNCLKSSSNNVMWETTKSQEYSSSYLLENTTEIHFHTNSLSWFQKIVSRNHPKLATNSSFFVNLNYQFQTWGQWISLFSENFGFQICQIFNFPSSKMEFENSRLINFRE
jgi:hypothetical protein